MALTDPLALLRRTDKWYLGNGGMLLYAPPFPQHLHVPGFWDECHFGDIAVPRLLCVSIAMEVGAAAEQPSGVRGPRSAEPVGGTPHDADSGPRTADGSVTAPDAGRRTPDCPDPEPHGAAGAAGSRALLPLDPYFSYWHWQPDEIRARYYLVEREGRGYKQQAGLRIFLDETRRLGPDGTLHCSLRFDPMADCPPTRLHVVAWTARQRTQRDGQPGDTHADFFSDGHALTYKQGVSARAHKRGAKPLTLQVTMDSAQHPHSLQATPSHSATLVPQLWTTPLWDSLQRGLGDGGPLALSGAVNGVNVLGSVVYAGLHWRVDVAGRKFAGEGAAGAHPPGEREEAAGGRLPPLQGIDIRVNVRDPRDGSRPAPGQVAGASAAAGKAPTGAGAVAATYHSTLATPDPTQAWREFLSLVPHFECSDPLLTRYYWYRWYGLRLNALPPGGNYAHPAVAEGIAYFRGVITYSLMCHLHECKWLADPALAAGCLRNHLAHQTRSGHFAGHIYVHHVNDQGFYHTDVGTGVRALQAHHPDNTLREELRPGLTRLLDFYIRERDREGLDLYDLWDQYETGQEFTSRYFHADERADLFGWEHKLRLKGVDVTCYVFAVAELLRDWAVERGDVREAQRLTQLGELTRIAVRQFMWDPEQQFFFDYSAVKKQRSPYWAAVGFYPLLSGLATDEMALAAGRHLLPGFLGGTGKFDTPWPTPTVPPDDPQFSAGPYWKGERANCPWNGRVWPMVNGHIVEALGRLIDSKGRAPAPAQDGGGVNGPAPSEGTYRSHLAWYLRRWIELMHFEKLSGQPGAADGKGEKDRARPNCFEHYHPYDGTACEYRGIDDYMHSWVADGILKYVCGVRVEGPSAVRSPQSDSNPGADLGPPTSDLTSLTGTAGPNHSASRLVVDPLDFGLTDLLLRDCRIAGRRLDICWNRTRDGRHTPGDAEHGGWRVYLDGELAFRADQPQRWEYEL
jgi:hypothetical protein